jgi:serine/threonine-protein kinase
MAEILLGRLVGPAGFERPVVVKRILPHLAREASFVEMFLDEARLAATIRHPNVVQVHELIHDASELCIVMEYLEGESLFGLMRRLARHDSVLDPALSAHVVAQAAAGLHAAHQIADADGKHLGLVHRDVSPQNIFVGFDGTVKVLDFGIAVVRDRTVRTRTGQLRGKHEYMSPEQCASQPLDRRSDVFSLGVVLYELSTGHRLYKRGNELLVLRAITEEPVRPPSTVRANYPRDLERIVLLALARSRSDRYRSALEMRRDLLVLSQQLGGPALPDEALAQLMRDLFSDRIEEKRELLGRLRSGSSIISLPAAEADTGIELPTATEVDAGAPTEVAEPRRRRRWLWAVGILALGAAGALQATRSRPPLPPQAAAARVEVPRPASAPRPARVSLLVESVPSGARLVVDGEPRGATPATLTLAPRTTPLALRLELPGYRVLEEQLVPDVDQRLRLVLVRAPAAPVPHAPVKSRGYRRFE